MGRAAQTCLEAMGASVLRVTEGARVAETVAAAARLAFSSYRAVAVLLSQQLIGAKAFK
jgi:sulfopyruvate decarboxylase TPP-binding subunit